MCQFIVSSNISVDHKTITETHNRLAQNRCLRTRLTGYDSSDPIPHNN